jgi:hypothetical protein
MMPHDRTSAATRPGISVAAWKVGHPCFSGALLLASAAAARRDLSMSNDDDTSTVDLSDKSDDDTVASLKDDDPPEGSLHIEEPPPPEPDTSGDFEVKVSGDTPHSEPASDPDDSQ